MDRNGDDGIHGIAVPCRAVRGQVPMEPQPQPTATVCISGDRPFAAPPVRWVDLRDELLEVGNEQRDDALLLGYQPPTALHLCESIAHYR